MEHEKLMALIVQEKPTIEGIIRLNATAGSDVGAIALQEFDFLSMHMIAKPFIANCIPDTIIQAIKYSLKNNLSLDPNAGLVYLMPTSVQVNGSWQQALEIKPTSDGRLSIAYQCGTILDNKRPVVVKDGNGKVVSVSVEILLPSVPEPRWEKIEMDQADFERLRKFSHIKNARGKNDASTKDYSNPLYTNFNGGIDPEFARSKVVSAALKKRGTNQAARLSDRIVVSAIAPSAKIVVEETEKKEEFTVYAEVISETTNPPKVEVEPKVETPKVEKPKVETPKVETPKGAETPKVETPKENPSLFPDANDL
jgi:hypothetical protein